MQPIVPLNDLSRQISLDMDEILDSVETVIRSGSYILGEEVRSFEKNLAEFLGTAFVRSCSTGTDAIVLALRALGVLPGDVVATVANAGGYTSTALHLIGAKALYVDCDSQGRMDPKDLESRLAASGPVKAVVVTHLYGLNSNIEECSTVCSKFAVPLVEDCAQSIGASINGKRLGSFGDVATFSFYPTKNLGALGDAGAVATSRPEIASKVESLRQYGWSSRYNVTDQFGSNSRMDEIQAAILNSRLSKVDSSNDKRRNIWNRYRDALPSKNWSIIGCDSPEFVGHLCVLLTPLGARVQTESFFKANGISTAVHYPVLDYNQLAWDTVGANSLTMAENLVDRILTIPLFPDMTEVEIGRVESTLQQLGTVFA